MVKDGQFSPNRRLVIYVNKVRFASKDGMFYPIPLNIISFTIVDIKKGKK
jgi:hypothetical protein